MRLGTLKDKIVPVILLIIAGLIVFIVFQQSTKTKQTIKVPVLANDIVAGVEIRESDISVKEVGKFNLSADILQKKEDIVGKYVAHDLYKGRYIFKGDITNEELKNSVIHKIKYGAISFNTNLTKSVGGLPKPGDWVEVRIIRTNTETRQIEVLNYEELKGIKLISIQNAAGEKVVQDKEKKDSIINANTDAAEKPAVVTFDARPEQADALLEGEYGGQLHMILIPAANQDDKYQESQMPERLKKAAERKKKEKAELEAAKKTGKVATGGAPNENKH